MRFIPALSRWWDRYKHPVMAFGAFFVYVALLCAFLVLS